MTGLLSPIDEKARTEVRRLPRQKNGALGRTPFCKTIQRARRSDSHFLDPDHLVAADALKVQQQKQENHRHCGRDVGIRLQRGPVPLLVGLHHSFLLRCSVSGLLCSGELRSIQAKSRRTVEIKELRRRRSFVFRIDGGCRLVKFLASKAVLAVAQPWSANQAGREHADSAHDGHRHSTRLREAVTDHGQHRRPEERFANGVAKAITAKRDAGQLPDTTLGMAALVAEVVKTREPGQNPATRTFQAFRMFINGELEELQQALEASLHVLAPGGRLVVISFHSLEDRMVKQFIAKHSREVYDRRTPFAAAPELPLRALGRQRPSAEEVKANPRSRSAIMRVAERVATAREHA